MRRCFTTTRIVRTFELPDLLHRYLLDYLPGVKGLQPSSIRSYRDSLGQFVRFAAARAKKRIVRLEFADIDEECVLSFLGDLEEHGCCPSTRNQRLSALHGFYEFVAQRHPDILPICARVAAIPAKRAQTPEARYLTPEELKRLFAVVHADEPLGRRDQALLLMLYNTGARASELAQLTLANTGLQAPAQVRLHGKGSKWRTCPLWGQTAKALELMLRDRASAEPESRLFLNRQGRPMTRFGIYKRVRHYAELAEANLPHVRGGVRVSPHVLRHTAAIHLLEAGVEVNVIRGWLGHASLETTNRYAEITLRMKAAALSICDPGAAVPRATRGPIWTRDKDLLAWLQRI